MTDSALTFTLIPLAIVAILGALAFFVGYRGVRKRQRLEATASDDWQRPSLASTNDAPKMRQDARIISQASDETVALVQFLDPASATSREVQPFIDNLVQEFGHTVTFIARYFPRPGDAWTEAAAVALEAAAEQGKFNEMLTMMYATQSRWAATEADLGEIFRGFANDLGLDIETYELAVSNPRTRERIEADKAQGTALGVNKTPTFFLLDGQKIEAASLDQFRQIVAHAATSK